MNGKAKLLAYQPAQKFLVCLDSDGCAFDTMGIKQRECFTPWMIAYFGLQPVAQAARECKEFADLFSKTRGANRHITLKRILSELLPGHPQVQRRGFRVPQLPHYFAWVERCPDELSNEGLKKAIVQAKTEEERREFELVLAWSERVNWAIKEIVKGIPPFPYVRETLARLQNVADVVVVSQTPVEALEREWAEHGIDKYVRLICGQEMGTKSQQIAATARHYPKDHVLMIGDAPGDLEAARENRVLFYPIIPGHEEDSWEEFYRVGLDRFLSSTYKGAYEEEKIAQFERALPERPPWEAEG
ncbi:MAG: HAD hydrolase-like protein [Candidatus Bipolaricaulota bacterium]|nr:HAD hydrolase-like protein [Candidatus Bipolaricaulota bacterium]MDW8127189.1 HAD hydrolase-like protein [Candidatus Bipolaricaulota bacterium]